MSRLADTRVGILGLGQIGGSLGRALKLRSVAAMVSGYDLNFDLMATALADKVIDHAAENERQLIELSEIIVLATPMTGIFATLREHAELLRSKHLVTDTGSLKTEVLGIASKLGLTNFVGGHPLAGTEKRGPTSWNGNLFVRANYFLAGSKSTDLKALELARELILALDAVPISVEPPEHDRIFATTSNLTHLFAYCLQHAFEDLNGLKLDKELFRCPSFSGATRIAHSDPEMVFQMLWYNRANLQGSLRRLIERLSSAREALDQGNELDFREIFDITE
jgi:prephenate dehydrogenase